MFARKNFTLIALLSLCAGCAPFGSDSNLERRVDEQDLQIRQMQPRQADTENELEAMRQEIAQLKGQIALMNQPEQAAAAAQAGDMPQGTAMTVNQSYEPVTGIRPNPVNAPNSAAYQPTSQAAMPVAGAAVTAGAAGAATAAASYGLPAQEQVEALPTPTEATWGQADPQPEPAAPAAPKDISLALFDAGLNDFHARKYAQAERSFRDFIKNYPKHAQVTEAQFYLAECQFQTNRFPDAALSYDTVIKKSPKTAQGRESMYKQAIAFSKMKQPAAAKARMQELISKFPNSAEAGRAKAFLKTNK